MHWECPAEAVARSLPAGLEVDLVDGRALLGIVAFTMRDVAPSWAPPLPGISHFHELNLRTYVVKEGVPGVWFYSLEAAGSVAVLAARAGWSLPYHRATMQLDRRADGRVRYRSRRRWPGPTPATFDASYRVGAPLGTAEPGTLDHFLVERYVLFTTRRGQLLSGSVHHEPYPLCEVELEHAEESLIAAAGLEKLPGSPLVHYSPGVDVDVYALEPWRHG